MKTSSEGQLQQPSIIQALLSGFNTIANNPLLILLPILLDLFLWFGPTWRIDQVFKPVILEFSQLPALNTTEYAELLVGFQSAWTEVIANFNLASSLRTLPIGVPSLMAAKPAFINPIGEPLMFFLESGVQFISLWSVFLLIGYFLGNLYFDTIARQIIDPIKDTGFKSLMFTYFQVLLLPILIIIILILLSIPALFVITAISLISPAIGQFLMFAGGIILLWIFIPLIFTPHGIFLYRQNIIESMMTSVKVVRFTMGKTLWFFLLSYILISGLDRLWLAPNVDNWFLIVGIMGRAFIITAVTAASFHFFIDATKFSQTILNRTLKSI